jgi:probable rRNA maturation factor
VTVSSAVRRCPLSGAAAAALARSVLRAEGVREAAVSVSFVGRRRIRSLNRRYLGHDRETDVIALAMPGGPGPLVGDVYCAPEVAARAARRYGVPVREELRRLVVHGVLHVLGHAHPEGEARLRSAMWARQERLLRRAGGAR